MLVALATLGPVLDHTPVASLAGLLFVVAYDLVDVKRIRAIGRASTEDAVAFTVTMIGTWAFSLDVAIYLGVGLSLVLFLRRARLVRVTELVAQGDKLGEAATDGDVEHRAIRLLHVEGALFFGAAGELRDALNRVLAEPTTRVLVVRLKRAAGLDATTATMLGELAALTREQGNHLILAGVTTESHAVLERSGALEALGPQNVFETRARWFSALASGLGRAQELCPDDTSFDAFLAKATNDEPAG